MDDAGAVEAVVAAERNVAHRIIEEFMLLANETVAAHLEEHNVPTLYRVHETPDPVKVAVFEEFISTLGYTMPGPEGDPAPRDFQKLVEKIRGTPRLVKRGRLIRAIARLLREYAEVHGPPEDYRRSSTSGTSRSSRPRAKISRASGSS